MASPGPEQPLEPGSPHDVLGTRLVATDYRSLVAWCHWRARKPGAVAIEFANTHIVTSRRHEPNFRRLTDGYDFFVPDATPLVWCLRRQGVSIQERVYGPTFMRECLTRTESSFSHYLLGGSEECAKRLRERMKQCNPSVRWVGGFHGRCSAEGRLEGAADEAVLTELDRLAPDFIWIGLGTPKQDAWICRNKRRLRRGVMLAVGFAFDVNAGMKPDAPAWMQQCGLTWLFRMASEPRRLVGRYVKYNSLFLWYLMWDTWRGHGATKSRGARN